MFVTRAHHLCILIMHKNCARNFCIINMYKKHVLYTYNYLYLKCISLCGGKNEKVVDIAGGVDACRNWHSISLLL